MKNYFLPLFSSETVSFFLPLALLEASTFLPSAVSIRFLNPCLLTRFLFEGWYVRFIFIQFGTAKLQNIFKRQTK